MNTRQFFPFAILSTLMLVVGCSEKPADKSAATSQPVVDPNEEMVAGSHILIMHAGCERAPIGLRRTQEEAKAFAEEIAGSARIKGTNFAELARKYSEGPDAEQGGSLGNFQPSLTIPEIGRTILKLKMGEISDPVKSSYGFHVILRKEVRIVSAKHILVMWHDSKRPETTQISRSKREAFDLISELQDKLKVGQKFEDLARAFSDCPSGKEGGDLREFGETQMVPAFATAAFALEVGSVSEIVETDFGYHLIERYK